VFHFLLQTLTALVDGVVKLIKAEFGYDLLDALMGFENADKVINNLLTHSSSILTGKQIMAFSANTII
jgi:hypothetical protein